VEGSCGHGNELLGSIKYWETLSNCETSGFSSSIPWNLILFAFKTTCCRVHKRKIFMYTDAQVKKSALLQYIFIFTCTEKLILYKAVYQLTFI
jgi:hypothetical protein